MEEKQQDAEHALIRVSVRSLVEFVLRSGNIDSSSGGMMVKDAMMLGSRLHRKLQANEGDSYEAEVPLAGEFPDDGFTLLVEGRADGIIHDGESITIDEIKGVLKNVENMEEPVGIHLAQAKVYAWLYLRDHPDMEQIGIRMSYIHLESEKIRRFYESYGREELRIWFKDVLDEYRRWADMEVKWKKKRTRSIKKLTFPFAYRDGQKQLAGYVYRTIAQGKLLFIQAPTGVGKTITTVFPAVKAMGEGLGDKLFYLTARSIARTAACEALELLRKRGMAFKSVELTAKEKICCLDSPKCTPQDCPRARGHYDRVNEVIYELLRSRDVLSREVIEEAAEKGNVCPFELSLDLSLWTDAVIGDYNYVFHPRSRLKRFFGEGIKGDYLFLIDEAHNLVDRGRDMFSAQIVKEELLALKKQVAPWAPALERALMRCNKSMLAMKRECEDYQVREDGPGTLPIQLMNLSSQMEDFLEETRRDHEGLKRIRSQQVPAEVREAVLDMYFQVSFFLEICDLLDEHYVVYTEHTAEGRFRLRLYNVDPSANLQSCLKKSRSAILFSATLLPIDYYKKLLCDVSDPYAVYAHSCFQPEKLRVLIGRDTSSLYKRRGPQQYQRMAEYILEMARSRPGHYMAFFPSFKMLEDVYEELLRQKEGAAVRFLVQQRHMSEEEREDFLREFRETEQKTPGDSLLGLCVAGSIFSEGIDLRGDSLIGAAVVGVPLPMVCTEQEILRRYYDERGEDGFYYAYLCPAMNRVLQAAGRVIRTEEDEGIVLLMDERFSSYNIQSMFPREWTQTRICSLRTFPGEARAFWEERTKPEDHVSS
ncbi:MAG: ATP-dependent DNA helicase [Lachnospiraceae bacterium]|nr:ATP-dependent DNA helicase [Lachnospiraceae bacterium]